MNKLYLVVPIVLTLAFGGVYYVHSLTAEEKAAAAKIVADQTAAVEAAKKADLERSAREDADRRSAERHAEEKRKEDERRAKWEAAGQAIVTDTASFVAQTEKNTAELKALEAKLTSLRAQKEAATEAAFALDLDIEKARIAKRNTELEIQRLVEMTARKAGTTLGQVTATP